MDEDLDHPDGYDCLKNFGQPTQADLASGVPDRDVPRSDIADACHSDDSNHCDGAKTGSSTTSSTASSHDSAVGEYPLPNRKRKVVSDDESDQKHNEEEEEEELTPQQKWDREQTKRKRDIERITTPPPRSASDTSKLMWFKVVDDYQVNPDTFSQICGGFTPAKTWKIIDHGFAMVLGLESIPASRKPYDHRWEGMPIDHFRTYVENVRTRWNNIRTTAQCWWDCEHGQNGDEKEERKPDFDSVEDQILLKFLYKVAQDSKLRRDERGAVFEPVMLGDIDTHAYRFKCHLETWIAHAVLPEDIHPYEYHLYTKRGNTPDHMKKIIQAMPDTRFPILKKDIKWFSLQNGVYNIQTCKFYYYDLQKTPNIFEINKDDPTHNDYFISSHFLDQPFSRKWLPSVEQQAKTRKEHKAREKKRAKIEEQLNQEEHKEEKKQEKPKVKKPEPPRRKLEEVSTEAKRIVDIVRKMFINDIFKSQDFTDEDIFWCLASLGRSLKPEEKDEEIATYFEGEAGTGKSTLLNIIIEMLDPSDVGFLMGDAETVFGQESLMLARLVVAMDWEKCNLMGTRLCTMVSREMLSIACKFKIAVQMRWTAPLLFASNGPPPWPDKNGNMLRRLEIWKFLKFIERVDVKLLQKCRSQLVQLLVMMTLAAKERRAILLSQSCWDRDEEGMLFLPPRVWKARDDYEAHCDSFHAFLKDSCELVDSEVDGVKWDELNERYKKWQKERGDNYNVRGMSRTTDVKKLTRRQYVVHQGQDGWFIARLRLR